MNITSRERFSFFSYLQTNYQTVVFVVYIILLSIAIAHHEPWMDEAQAWLLAKDLGVKDLLIKYLRYEGSPGLWHLILMIPAKLGLPYFTINIVSGIFSSAGVWLFLRYAPFPPLIKVLYPFSFFVFFQYGVVARSYCLIAPILFLLALTYDRKNTHPFRFILLLCLLANVSAHTFLIAGSIAFLHFIDVIKNRKDFDSRLLKRHLFAIAAFGLVALLVIFIVMTPPDQIYAGSMNWGLDNFIWVTKRMTGGSLVLNEFGNFYWLSGVLSLGVFIVTVIWLSKNKMSLLYLLPLLLLSILFAIKYRNWWHQGVLFLLWIFVLWISYERYRDSPRRPFARTLLGAICFVLAVQVYWCIDSLAYDLTHNYSASRTVAKYIKAKRLHKDKIYVSGWRNISILPYFPKNIFYNHNSGSPLRFWNWSVNNVTSVGAEPPILDTIGCEQPATVIFASDHIPGGKRIELPGYKATAFFRGYLCWKTGVIEPECYLLFTKKTEEEKRADMEKSLAEALEKTGYTNNAISSQKPLR